MKDLEGIKEFLSSPRKILITTHVKPDGDALGSMLALYHYFLLKGHNVFPVSPTDYGYYLHWMPGSEAVLNFQAEPEKVLKYLEDVDIIVCLDFNSLHRIERLGEHINNSPAPKLMIDHHLEPEEFDQWRLWNPDASSTAELVYDFIEEMGDKDLVNKMIGTAIYTGILTDSGSFRYPNVTARVHTIVSALLSAGVDHSAIHSNIYDTFSESRLRFFGYCISEKMVMLNEYRTAYISVNKEELKKYNVITGDTEGLVNYPMSINSINFVALIVEREGIIKISMRSKGSFPANEFASKYFNGGGHFNAAGGSYRGSLSDAIVQFEDGLKEYKNLLNAL